jgi:hypothetical protein
MFLQLNLEDINPIETTFTFEGVTYVAKEAMGNAANKWRSAIIKATRQNAEGKLSPTEHLPDTEPLLVSLCTFTRSEGKDEPVDIKTVKNWPSRLIKRVFNWIKEVSELGEGETKEELEKQLKKTQERLDKLNKGETPEGNE